MLKEKEIALTLRISWIMKAVSINVCIINHISTNRTSVEPVVLSDMETGLPCCLGFTIIVGSMICRFLHGLRSEKSGRHTSAALPTEGGLIVFVWMGRLLLSFTQEGRENGEEMQAGSAVKFHLSVSLYLSKALNESAHTILNTCTQRPQRPRSSF